MCDFVGGFDKITGENARDIFKKIGEDFVVQEYIKAHTAYEKFYKNSINTIRVITYILNDKCYVAPLTIRVGQGVSCVDNAHAGGMFVGVFEDGRLCEEAYTEFQTRYKVHPDSGIEFASYTVPYISNVVATAKKLHSKIPMLKFVSWDFAVDEESKPVLIEVNLRSQTVWFSRMANGKVFFGKNTERVIRLLNGEKN